MRLFLTPATVITTCLCLLGVTGAGCSKGGEVEGAIPDAGDTGATDGDTDAVGGSGGSSGSGGTGGVSECSVDAECTDFDTCNGDERCVDNKCEPPLAPAPKGTICGAFFVCIDGLCQETPNICHDGLVGLQEDCDDENTVAGDGCENDCKFTCITSDPTRNCTPLDICEGLGVCDDTTHTCSAGIPLPDGTLCGTGQVCVNGVCSTPCVDGNKTTDEECDDNNLISGDGCNNDCRFSCLSTDSTRDCSPTDPCQGTSTCNDTTHTCSTRTPLADGTSCGSGKRCYTGKCCDPTDSVCQTVCNLAGTWGVKITTDVTWDARTPTLAGSGQIIAWGKMTRTVSGTTTTDRTTACGLQIPDFTVAFTETYMETYGLTFPDTIFDDHPLPVVTITGTLSGVRQGDTYRTPSAATMLGIEGMPSPETWPWPDDCNATCLATEFQQYLADHDADGHPGVTALSKTGTGYSFPPTNVVVSPPPRADTYYLAVRQVSALSGTLSSCTEISGVAGVTATNSRILGCRQTDGVECDNGGRAIGDSTRPLFRPRFASFEMKKLSTSATCAAVRSALP